MLTCVGTELQRTQDVEAILAATRHNSIDQLLNQLDADFELDQRKDTFCIGPFGILCLNNSQLADEHAVEECETASMNTGWEDFVLGDFSANKVFSGFESGVLESPKNVDSELSGNGFDLPLMTPNLQYDVLGPFLTPMQLYMPHVTDMQILVTPVPSPRIQRPMSVEYASDLTDVDISSIRLLLVRYQENLVPAFAPVQVLTKSLWQRVHIPRVYDTLGEILVKGDAGDPKVALLFAVLSAASYYLDTMGRGPPHHTLTPWKDMGRLFRQRAKARLASSFKTADLGRNKEQYKDMLLAILSMVTVCVSHIHEVRDHADGEQVVSGDMLESHVYLRGVEQWIGSYCSPQLLKSTSIRMLHSTFLYLWTLQASVRVFSIENQGAQMPLTNGISFSSTDSRNDADVWRQLMPIETEVDDTEDNDSRGSQGSPSIFEKVYSVSETLFRLIGRVTSLASRSANNDDGSRQPVDSSKEIADIENEICSWKNDLPAREQQRTTEASNGSTDDVRYYFQTAMHSALLIYFYKCVRSIDTYTVQPYVEKTLLHLQLYTQAKRISDDQSSSICWPGFIAGCEALGLDLRQKMSQWFVDETAQTGIRMFEMAGNAAKEVWSARDQSGNRNLPWSKVLQNDNVLDQLMLS